MAQTPEMMQLLIEVGGQEMDKHVADTNKRVHGRAVGLLVDRASHTYTTEHFQQPTNRVLAQTRGDARSQEGVEGLHGGRARACLPEDRVS